MNQDYHPYLLHFFDADMESAYANSSRKRRLAFFKLICAFGLVIQIIYITKDVLSGFEDSTYVRIFAYLPVLLGGLLHATFLLNKRNYRWLHDPVVVTTVFLVFLAQMLVTVFIPDKLSSLSNGLPTVIYGIFIFSGLWIRQLYILGTVTYIVGISAVFYFIPDTKDVINLIIIISINYSLAIAARFNAEKSYRQGFLEKEKLREHEVMTQRLNQELFYQKRLYEGIVDNSSDAFGIMSTDGNIDFISNSSNDLFGENKAVQLHKKASELVHKQDIARVKGKFDEAIKTGESVNVEFRITNTGKQPKWVHTIANPISDNSGNVTKIMVYTRDISTKKQEEQNLIKSKDQLEELNAQKNRFFSILSHDLRGTIGTLASMLEFLKQRLPSLNEEELHEFLANINSSAQKSYKFLEDMLAWSKSQMSTTTLDQTSFDIGFAITEAKEPLIGMLEDKNLTLTIDVPADTLVFADRNMITTSIRNIVSNAIKFSEENDVITVSLLSRRKFTTISISDNGVGIEEDRISSLFRIDKFQSTPGTKNETGTGLGLILCRDLIESNGGSINIKSEVNKGTRVIIQIPSSEPSN